MEFDIISPCELSSLRDTGKPRLTPRQIALAGTASAVLFWTALLAFGSLDPTYSQVTRAVSELGMAGAPHQWAWNVTGFILPGILLAGFGLGMARTMDGPASVGAALLCLSGIFFAATGIFPADLQNMKAFATRAHILASLASFLVWLPAPILIAVGAKRRAMRALMWVSIAGLICVLSGVIVGREVLARGLAQRLNFATYFAWVLAVALIFMRQAEQWRPRFH